MNKKDSRSWIVDSAIALMAVSSGGVLLWLVSFHVDGSWGTFLEKFGEALIVAGFIGLAVEIWLKRGLASEAVEATLGYGLHEEVKQEMRDIYKQNFVCMSSSTKFTLKDSGKQDLVVLRITSERTLKNVTNRTHTISPKVEQSEWCREGLPTKILELVCDRSEANPSVITTHPNRLVATLPAVTVPKFETCLIKYTAEETRGFSDFYHEVFIRPTKNPVASFEIDDALIKRGVHARIKFGCNEENKLTPLGENGERLEGMLLPYQHIEIMWWSNDAKSKK